MAPERSAPPQVKIGFPHDPVVVAKKKEATLNDLLSKCERAWKGYFQGLSLAYIEAHTNHVATLGAISERIRNQQEFLKSVVLGVFIPSMIGGGMAALVKDKGMSLMTAMLPVATKRQHQLSTFAVEGTATIAEDVIKLEVTKAAQGVVAEPGAEWDAVGDDPLKFFLQLEKMVNDYTTDVAYSVTLAKARGLDEYVNTVNAHLLSPFIQNAPMDTSRLYGTKDLAPVFEVFLWVVWARARNVKYWVTQIGLATEPNDRSFIGKIWDGITMDDDALDRVKAYDAVKTLDPILQRLLACRVSSMDITQSAGWDTDRRILNILWVRMLGEKHKGSLLGDLVANLDAKNPTSALDGKPVDKSRRLM